jgi:transcriptional regulator with XRE-family HTH domain
MCYVATLGGFLRNELQRRDWSPEEFARRCDPPISTTLAYQILSGKDNVKRSTFGAIAAALGMTPVELMAASDDSTEPRPLTVAERIARILELVPDIPHDHLDAVETVVTLAAQSRHAKSLHTRGANGLKTAQKGSSRSGRSASDDTPTLCWDTPQRLLAISASL